MSCLKFKQFNTKTTPIQ